MTDKELERIYNEGYRAVYWTAMQLLKSEADAEDVVQDTFVALIESYDTINDKDKVIPWLKKIAANKCLNRLTRTKTDAVEDEFFEDVEAMPEDFLPDTIIESEEARRIVMDIIDNSLSDDIRRTLILFYFDEMSTKEIAKSLGVPEGTVRRRLNFARNKIKKEVEKYEKDNKTKLFGMALTFLSKLFIKEAEQVPFKAMPAKLISLSASAQATHAGAASKIALTGAKKGTGIMLNKVIIATVASVVVVGGVIAGIVVLNNRENVPTTEETTVITEVTEDSAVVSNATTDTTTSETDISVSDTTALSSRTMRELTDDDLIIEFGLGTGYMGGSIQATVVHGTVSVGDELRLVGHAFEMLPFAFDGADHISTTVTALASYPAGDRDPLQSASAGDVILIKLDGIDPLDAAIHSMVAIKEDSDLTADAIGVEVTVTIEEGTDWLDNHDGRIRVEFLCGDFGPDGNMTGDAISCYEATATVLERNGDTVTMLVTFDDYHYFTAPGLECYMRYIDEFRARGIIDVVYLEET